MPYSSTIDSVAGTSGHSDEACKRVDSSITRVFGLLGKRWTGPIISVLLEQPGGFSAVRRAIPGISERMLSDRLAELVAEGLVVREVSEGPPLRVSYRVTGAGAGLGPALRELVRWADEYLPVGEGVRDADRTCADACGQGLSGRSPAGLPDRNASAG